MYKLPFSIRIPIASQRGTGYLFYPLDAWLAIGFLLGLTLLLLLAGQGRMLHYAFPGVATIVGVYLYYRYPILYSGFVWWIWFLTALVRRLADYRSAFTEPNPILLTPYLVALISLIGFLESIKRTRDNQNLPFYLAFSGILYAFFIGIINFSIPVSILAGLEWASPVVFGHFLFSQWRDYPYYRKQVYRIFLISALITGTYGVWQYLVAPDWDRVWLIGVDLVSAGLPEPLGMRVWSTMHSHGVFAAALLPALLLLLGNKSTLGLISSAVGYLAFLLTSARTVWLGWLVGLFFLFAKLRLRLKVKMLIFLFLVSLIIAALTQIDLFSEKIIERLATFSDITSDGSAEARQQIYAESIGPALTNFIGNGLNKKNGFDSGIITMLLSLGLLGTTLYILGFILILVKVETSKYIQKDDFVCISKAIVYGTCFQILGGSVMLALPGTIIWSFAALSLASHRYHLNQVITTSSI